MLNKGDKRKMKLRDLTKEQNLDRQLEEFKNYNIDKIYCEKETKK